MKDRDSRSRWGTYVSTEGRFNADAAPLRRRFKDSLYGEVPIVVPAVFETIYRIPDVTSQPKENEKKRDKFT